ncbi:hypothetical protein ACOKM3_35875 [Streptomyces sp. BH106]|uniref:hypothetical protein n=1 Tax=Streptomyces sp. BH106 TaxID=3410409 RepID=UPI003CF10E95
MADEHSPPGAAEQDIADALLKAEQGESPDGAEPVGQEPAEEYDGAFGGGDIAGVPDDAWDHIGARKPKPRPIESADEALKRAAEPEIVNEILAGGAVAASFTAAATVAKAKIEATTQRRKNDLDAETERLRIAAEERIAGFQSVSGQASEIGSADPDGV